MTFRDLGVGDTFTFFERDSGPWIKVSARRYRHSDPGAVYAANLQVKSIKARVDLAKRDTVAAEYAQAARDNDPFR